MKYSSFDTWFAVLKVRNEDVDFDKMRPFFEECWEQASKKEDDKQKIDRLLTSLEADCMNMQNTVERLKNANISDS